MNSKPNYEENTFFISLFCKTEIEDLSLSSSYIVFGETMYRDQGKIPISRYPRVEPKIVQQQF